VNAKNDFCRKMRRYLWQDLVPTVPGIKMGLKQDIGVRIVMVAMIPEGSQAFDLLNLDIVKKY